MIFKFEAHVRFTIAKIWQMNDNILHSIIWYKYEVHIFSLLVI
jgi:hypothetical protein